MGSGQIIKGFSLNLGGETPDPEWFAKAIRWLRGDNYNQAEYGAMLYGLVRQRRPRTIVDIGTARGFSAVCMARALIDAGVVDGRIYTMDIVPHDEPRDWHAPKHPASDPLAGRQWTRQEFIAGFAPLEEKITFLRGPSAEIVGRWPHASIDLAFIDGLHSEAGVEADINALLPHLSDDAILIFDDYGPRQPRASWHGWFVFYVKYAGVYRAVQRLVDSGGWVLHAPQAVGFDRIAILQRLG